MNKYFKQRLQLIRSQTKSLNFSSRRELQTFMHYKLEKEKREKDVESAKLPPSENGAV